MSVAGLLSSGALSIFNHLTAHANSKDRFRELKQEFQQLGSNLKSGNLSQAQSDFAALQQNLPGASQYPSGTSQGVSQSSSQSVLQPSAQTPLTTLNAAVNQLAQDLQSGNLAAAKSDFTAVQQDVQAIGQQQGAAGAHHHHHSDGSNANPSSSPEQAISSLFNQLGQSLQSGNLLSAQQAYATLQQDLQQLTLGDGVATSNSTSAAVANVNVSA